MAKHKTVVTPLLKHCGLALSHCYLPDLVHIGAFCSCQQVSAPCLTHAPTSGDKPCPPQSISEEETLLNAKVPVPPAPPPRQISESSLSSSDMTSSMEVPPIPPKMVRASALSPNPPVIQATSPHSSAEDPSSGGSTPVKVTFGITSGSEVDSVGSSTCSSSSSLTSPPPIPARSYSLNSPRSSPVVKPDSLDSLSNTTTETPMGNGDATLEPPEELPPKGDSAGKGLSLSGRTPEPNPMDLETTLSSMTEKETDVWASMKYNLHVFM